MHQVKGGFHDFMRRRIMADAYLPLAAAPSGGRLLDFGCGDGWFLRNAIQKRWDAVGFEINPDYARALRESAQLPVESDLDIIGQRYGASFDFITLHFVFEHLSDPMGTILSLAALLRPGGEIFITVPNIASAEFRLFGKLWHGLDAPRHLSFFEEKHMSALAQRAGLSLSNVRPVYVPNTLAGSLATIAQKRFSYGAFAALIVPCFFLCRHRPSGNISFTLRKRVGPRSILPPTSARP